MRILNAVFVVGFMTIACDGARNLTKEPEAEKSAPVKTEQITKQGIELALARADDSKPDPMEPIRDSGTDLKNMCALYPNYCVTILSSASFCSNWAGSGANSNTLRHQCWSCVMTILIGDPNIAKGIADIHEGGTTNLRDRGELADSCIDEVNNRAGCRIGSDLLNRWEWWWGTGVTGAFRFCTQEIMNQQPGNEPQPVQSQPIKTQQPIQTQEPRKVL